MAAQVEKELGIKVAVEDGPFGMASVLVDGHMVTRTGWSGWLPPGPKVVEIVRAALELEPRT